MKCRFTSGNTINQTFAIAASIVTSRPLLKRGIVRPTVFGSKVSHMIDGFFCDWLERCKLSAPPCRMENPTDIVVVFSSSCSLGFMESCCVQNFCHSAYGSQTRVNGW